MTSPTESSSFARQGASGPFHSTGACPERTRSRSSLMLATPPLTEPPGRVPVNRNMGRADLPRRKEWTQPVMSRFSRLTTPDGSSSPYRRDVSSLVLRHRLCTLAWVGRVPMQARPVSRRSWRPIRSPGKRKDSRGTCTVIGGVDDFCPPAAAGAGWKRWASPTTFQPRRKRRRDRLLRSRESGAPCGVPYGPGTGAAQRAESGRSHPTSPRPRPRGGPCAPATAPSLHRHSPASPVRRASPPPRPAWPVGPVGAGHATDGASLPSSVRAAPTPPAQPTGAGARGARFPTDASLPRSADGSASASPVSRPEACSAFTRVAARTVAQAALGGLLHRSASIGCLPSISRSDCDRLERQWPGGIRTR